MKQRTKVLSVVMAILLTLGSILSPLSMSVEAQDVTDASSSEYRLILDIQQMGEGRTDFPFGYKNYHCETNNTQIIASAGYTNVITYCADADGYLRVDDFNVELKGTDKQREVEFAVVDDAGVILTNQGKVITVNSDNPKEGLNIEAFEVKNGESIHFVFHGVIENANSLRCSTKIMYSADGEKWVQKNSTGKLWASVNTNTSAEQGAEGLYYNYSTTYVKEEIKQDSVGIVYKDMRDGRSERADFPFMHVKNACMTNDIQIIAGKEYTNVVAYQMPSDGKIKVEELEVWLLNTKVDRTVEFAVIDSSGKVLSNNGKIIVLNNTNTTKSGMTIDAQDMKQGERLYFVFHGIEGGDNPIRCSAKIMRNTDGSTWTQANQYIYNGKPLVWPANTTLDGYEQGVENFYYGYSDVYVTHEYTAPSTQEPDIPTVPNVPELPTPGDEGTPKYKIDFEAAEMERTTVPSASWWTMPNGVWNCMTNSSGQKVVSPGYVNIITYKANKAGTITLKNMTASVNVTNAPENVVLFAITDKEGNILYPADETLTVLNKDNQKITGVFLENCPIEENDEINFIFEGVVGTTASCWLEGTIVHTDIEGNETILEREDKIIGLNVDEEQGTNGFYYRYANKFQNNVIGHVAPSEPEEPDDSQEPDIPTVPNVPTVPTPDDEGTPKYKIDFEAAEMERTTVPSASWWTMPNGVWNCMTNSSGQKVVSPGYVNIITYKANKAGTITLKNMTASVNVTNAPENVVLFAITDKEGNILYPADETLTVLNKDNQKITGVFLENCPIEENDEINFIFEGVVGTTASCWLEGTIVHTDIEGNETILEREDKIIGLNVDEEQGTNGFYYRYANKFQNNVIGHVTPSEPDNSDDTQEPTQPTTPIVPGTATVPEKNKDGHMPTYKINFEARNMEACNVKNFPWFMPNTEYDCMTNPLGNQIVSKGYANILTYKAQKAGELSLEGMTAGINIKDQPENVAVLFAITDKDGNILYPSDGTLAVLNKDNQEITGTFLSNHKVKEGDELNFIFQGVEGKTVSCRVRGMMFYTDSEGKRTRISRESGGYIAPLSGSTEQGAEGFYYRYAKTFKNDQIGYVVPPAPEVIPGTATIPKANAEGHMPMYKIDFEAADMVASTVHKLFPWSMPDKEYDCMTNPAGNQIVSKGYANIITYKAQKAGTLTLKNMTAGINVTNAPENAVLFAITDKEGNVLYPADGTLAVLNKDNATITGTFLKDYKVEKGDEINFIFEGVEGKTIACRIRGILVHTDSEGKETRLTREDGGYIAPISGSTAQGADGFSYRYAKKFENVILGYVAPKSKAVQWGEGIQVAVSNNPDDFVYYETTTGEEATEKVDMLEIIKLGVELRYKFIPWIIVAVSGVVFGTQWVVFLIKRRKGEKQNEENS